MYSLVVFVPSTHAAAVRSALATSGAGALGAYDSCSFTASGTGRFRPLAGAQPFIGTAGGAVETVEEVRIETDVLARKLPQVLTALRAAHPYEKPGIHVTQLVDWEALIPAQPRAAHPDHLPVATAPEGSDGVGK